MIVHEKVLSRSHFRYKYYVRTPSIGKTVVAQVPKVYRYSLKTDDKSHMLVRFKDMKLDTH